MRRCIGWADRTNRYAVTAAIEEQGMASAHNDTFSFSGLWRFERIVSGDQDKGQLRWILFYSTISIGFLTSRPIGWCCAVNFLCELNIQTRHRAIPILARTHWLFRPATLENDRRLWGFIVDRVWAAPRPAGADRVLSRGLIGRATEPRLGVGAMLTPTMPTRVSAHAGYGRCRRTWDHDRAHDTKVLCT